MDLNVEWQKLNLMKLGLALGSTSLLENILYHPWWVLKTREQVETPSQQNVFKNSLNLVNKIWKNEGMRALYRGFWAGTIGTFPSGYIYLIVYHKTKHELSSPSVSPSLRLWSPFLAGTAAEAASIGLFVPIDVITQRMQLKKYSKSSFWEISQDIIKNEGVYGLYRGTLLTAFKLGLGSGTWWLCYEHMKTFTSNLFKLENKESKVPGLFAGFVAGLFSTVISNPLDVVKTRIQTQVCLDIVPSDKSLTCETKPFTSVISGFKNTWKLEGWRGLNRGLVPKLVSQGPLSAIWALVYEMVLQFSLT